MSTVGKQTQGGAGGPAGTDRRRWVALAVLTAMQFMLVMDVTVVNIALPDVQDSLHFSYEGLAWVVNAYVLTAGGFLLLGGRIADMYGRRRLFMTGVLIFGLASVACGSATASWALVSSRFVQGLGEALAGPAALGLIPVLFPDRAERTKALGIWGGLSALGGAVGSVVGGAVTDLVNWRWIFFINVPIALFALITVPRVMTESRMARAGRRIDVVGALTATGGLVAVVYGLLQAAAHPWGSARVLLPLLGGIALLVVMVLWESRTPDPMIPMRFFSNRTRVTSNVVSVASLAGFHTYAFLLSLYIQQELGYSPLKTGLSYIPLTVAMGVGVGVSTALMPRIGVKAVITLAFLGSGVALFVVAGGLAPDASYVSGVMPGLILFGFFNALGFPALINGALHQVTGQDSGLASGVQTAMQQVGAALGLATLVPFALRYVNHQVKDGTAPAVAQADGYALALRIGAGVLVAAALLVLLLLEKVSAEKRDALVEAADAADTADTTEVQGATGATGAARVSGI
ncbi:MFS transporter [Streptomyces sp. NPDC096012]|uniref:MFS transporter n=1 Tax=Streptomyces sp. NPDC096012 TaxID=3155684 RepID=UPI00336A10B7